MNFLYTNMPLPRFVRLYCFLLFSIVKSNTVLNLRYTGGHNRKSRTDSNPRTLKLSFSRMIDLEEVLAHAEIILHLFIYLQFNYTSLEQSALFRKQDFLHQFGNWLSEFVASTVLHTSSN